MGRIALFVVVVGGLSYLAIDAVAGRLTQEEPSLVLTISLAVIAAVIFWTVLVWFVGDRMGQRGGDHDSGDGNG